MEMDEVIVVQHVHQRQYITEQHDEVVHRHEHVQVSQHLRIRQQ